VLVPEKLLDLAQVRARAQKLGGEDVAKRVRGDALALAYARRAGVATEGGGKDRGGEASAKHPHEQRGVVAGRAHSHVGEEGRHETGVDWHDPLAAPLEIDGTHLETWIRSAVLKRRKPDDLMMDGSEGENVLLGVGK
jgi:hypothetical protein